MLFRFIDLDGTDTIEYTEFFKKLKRSGITVRKKEEELVYTLYNAITKANLSLRQAFDAFDYNKDGSINMKEMEDTLKTLRIPVPRESIEYVFKMADISNDNLITYEEFSALFENFVKDSIR